MSRRLFSENETERLTDRLRPDTLGQVFGTMVIVGVGLFFLSFFSLFGYVILASPQDGSPIPLPIVVLGALSWGCVVISLFSYVVWESWKLRGHLRTTEQSSQFASEDSHPYEVRQRRILFALGLGIFALLIPVAVFVGN